MGASRAPLRTGKVPTDTDLAYLAGVIDSDGSIYISKQPPYGTQTNPAYRLVVNISQNTQEAQDFAESLYGGVRRQQEPDGKSRVHTLFRWQIDGHRAVQCIKDIYPFLKVKRLQAWLGLEFRANLTMHNPLHLEDLAVREGFYLAMKQAKVGAMTGGDVLP